MSHAKMPLVSDITLKTADGDMSAPPQPRLLYDLTKRAFDILLSIVASAVLSVPILLIAAAIRFTSKGPVLHWSKRIGRYNVFFLMPKFRTMQRHTPQVATHLLDEPERYVTSVGRFLRKTSLDELPQLYSILKGDLSFVGPRPALFNQDDLVALRTAHQIHKLVPGLTGWAQINGRDELSVPEKVNFELDYLVRRSLAFDLRILLETLLKAFNGRGVSH
jgi:O-antigen biosynthesis protein WbqP